MEKVIFLDRDGTINIDHGYVYKVEDWEFTDRAPAALKKLQDAGYKLAIVTNQSGIPRGYYTEDAMHALHAHMESLLEKEGVTIDAIAFCPHMREGTCDCRKPLPGMARQIEQQLGAIDYANSWTIGDKEADVGLGKAIGTKTALVQSEYWEGEELSERPDMVVASLFEAAEQIVHA